MLRRASGSAVAVATAFVVMLWAIGAASASPATRFIGQSVTPVPYVSEPALLPPATVRVVPSDQRAFVLWTPPVNNGGSPVTAYKVTPYLGSVGLFSSARAFPATSRGGLFSGLANGTAYSFRVAAVNAVGVGYPRVTAPVIVGSPVAPVASAFGRSTSAFFNVEVPHHEYGLITSCVVTVYLGFVQQVADNTTVPCEARTAYTKLVQFEVSGLVYGTNYVFRLQLKNKWGLGPAGFYALKIGDHALIGQLAAPEATGWVGQATVTWKPVIDSYSEKEYRVTPYLEGVAQIPVYFYSPQRTANLSGLVAGGSYTFTINQRNLVDGWVPESAPSNAVTPS